MDNTIIQQGRFTSAGVTKTLEIRSDVDWMKVLNYTVADDDTTTTAVGVEYYWQRGFAQDAGIEYKKSNAANAAQLTTVLASGGFTLIDSTANPVGNPVALTSSTNATQPVFTVTASTAGLVAGDIVRVSGVSGQQNLGGLDFTIDTVVANTSFRWANALANAPGSAGTGGNYRKIKFNPIFYPRNRTVCNITQAAQAVVTTTVDHSFTVGQKIRFNVPAPFGMVQLDGVQATIVAVSASTLTVDVDTSAFTAFAWPLNASFPFNFAQVVPVGEDTAEALSQSVNILADATVNTGYIGMQLAAGANSPAGTNGQVVYWVAGKSFSVDNQ
jgi:hypothetical protein